MSLSPATRDYLLTLLAMHQGEVEHRIKTLNKRGGKMTRRAKDYRIRMARADLVELAGALAELRGENR